MQASKTEAIDESETLASVVAAPTKEGGFDVGVAVLKPAPPNYEEDDEDDVAPRRELHVYAFEDDQFLTTADALLVREGPSVVVHDQSDQPLEQLVSKHKTRRETADLEGRGWPKVKAKLEATVCDKLSFLCGETRGADACLRDARACRAAAHCLERAGLGDERADDAGRLRLAPGVLATHMRLDSAAAEAATILPVSGGSKSAGPSPPSSLLEVLGGPCKTPAGGRLVERWLRQPSLDKAELETRYDVVELLRDDTSAREAIQRALGGTGARVPDLAKLSAKLRNGSASLLDLHKLHVVAGRVLPEVAEAVDLAASSEVNAEGAAALRTDVQPRLAKAARDLRVFCDMADATLDLDFLPDVLLKASVDEALVDHAASMRTARNAVDDAHEAINDAFANANLGNGKSFSPGAERSKWPVKVDRDKDRGHIFRSIKMYDEKQLAGVTVAGARGGSESIEVISYLKAGVFFTTPSLDRACASYKNSEKAYKAAQKALTAELVKTAATYAPVFCRAAAALARLDALAAFAHAAAFAPGGRYERPVLDASPGAAVSVKGARHPVVEHADGVHFVATDYALDATRGRLVVVTGPNMGGKSTHIRGLACLAVMAQAGSLLPVAFASLPLFDTVLARVGAGDSLQRGVSTFMAEMLEASTILRLATPRSLVVIDELGRGTSTYDGFGLAWAISERVVKQGAACLFATHFHELTQLEAEHPGAVRNRHVTAHVDDDTGELAFLYEVADGPCTESFGIKVAELAGFPARTVEVAKRKAAELEGIGKRAKVGGD